MHFDTSSPESGWEPFVEWLRELGLDPHAVWAIDVDESAMTVTVSEYEMPKRVVGKELAKVAPRTLPITSLPPRRVAA